MTYKTVPILAKCYVKTLKTGIENNQSTVLEQNVDHIHNFALEQFQYWFVGEVYCFHLEDAENLTITSNSHQMKVDIETYKLFTSKFYCFVQQVICASYSNTIQIINAGFEPVEEHYDN